MGAIEQVEMEQERDLLALLIEAGHLFVQVNWLEIEDFVYQEHRDIFAAVAVTVDNGEGINQVSVYNAFRRGRTDASSMNHLAALFRDTPISRGVDVRDLAVALRRRRIERDMRRGIEIDTVKRLARDMEHVREGAIKRIELIEALHRVMDDLDRGDDGRISTGYPRLDHRIGGLRPTDFIVIAGRPSMGKTTFALNLAYNVAKQKMKVEYYNLEMSCSALAAKIFAREAEINNVSIRDHMLTDYELKKLFHAGNRITEARPPLVIYDAGKTDVATIREKIREEGDVRLVVVDQLLKVEPEYRRERRDLEIADITFGLKAIAKEFEIPVILLHQISREVEKRVGDKMPNLSDLRDSGAVEQDADVVMFVNRDSYYDADKRDDPTMVVRVAKNKMGETGDVYFYFNRQISRIAELNEEEESITRSAGRIPVAKKTAAIAVAPAARPRLAGIEKSLAEEK